MNSPRQGRGMHATAVPDEGRKEGRSPFEVESGLLYMYGYCARAFTPLNTQRRHTEIQEPWKCTGYTHAREGEREGEGGRERKDGQRLGNPGSGENRESRKRKLALANHPEMGYFAFMYACVCMRARVYFVCHQTPPLTAHQQTARISHSTPSAIPHGYTGCSDRSWTAGEFLADICENIFPTFHYY